MRRDSSRQIRPPTHHSRRQRRRHALAHWTCSTPYTGCASAHLIRISRVTGGCWIVRVSAGRRYQSSGTADWMVGRYPLLAAAAKRYLSECKNRIRISLHKIGRSEISRFYWIGLTLHMTGKIVFEMTYNVSSGMLNTTIPSSQTAATMTYSCLLSAEQ